MSIRSVDRLGAAGAALAVALAVGAAWAQGYPARFDFGAPATPQEVAAVAIAVDAEGRGLPPGKGDYETGKKVYEAQCQACHGDRLQGVANLPDMPSGAALRLIGGRGTLTSPNPVLTVESYWPYATTLFDYIRRAMPFQSPGSLSNDEVYAVSAFILVEAKILDRAAIADAQTLTKVQMPNRDGFVPDTRPEFFR